MIGTTAKHNKNGPILSKNEIADFEEEYNFTFDSQASYRQILCAIMDKKGLNNKDAAELTGLPETAFHNLDKAGGRIPKRYVISIAVGFSLDLHITEYILQACGMCLCESNRLDKAYMYLIENYKGIGIAEANDILRDLGVNESDMLGELCRGPYRRYKRQTDCPILGE